MKKYYLSLATLVFAGLASAQAPTAVAPKKMNSIGEVSEKTQLSSEKGITLFTFDFSNAGAWSFADNSGSGDDWVIGTTAPSGSFAIDPIASTTAANGFALFDSDLMCSGDQDADVRLVAPVDLSASPNVSLQFQSFYRKYQGNCYVIASTDGTNWTQFEVHAGLTANVSTANPTNVQVNLSSIIGGSSTAYIGFRYIGGCDYAWMVDDVKIVETDDYDLSITGLHWGSTGNWGPRLPYYQIPLAQISPITFGGLVTNNGGLSQSDAVFSVAIPSASYSSTSAPGTLAPNAADTLDATATFTPGATAASYAVTAAGVTSGATDAAPADNVMVGPTFATNNYIFARDNGTITGGSYNQGNAYQLGNVFDITANANITGVDVFVASTTVAGTEAFATLYDMTAGTFVYVGETQMKPVTLNALNTFVFDNPYPLTAGGSYLVTIGTFGTGGANNDLVVGAAGVSEPQTTFLLDGEDYTVSADWFYTTSTPMVRMNFNPSLSVNDNVLASSMSVYPNPASDKTMVSFETNGAEAVVVVTDLSGKVINTTSTSTGNVEINTASFAAGMYNVTVTSNNSSATSKLVVRK